MILCFIMLFKMYVLFISSILMKLIILDQRPLSCLTWQFDLHRNDIAFYPYTK